MQKILRRSFGRFCRGEDGATAIEYGLIASLIAVVIIGALVLVNGSMTEMYEQIRAAIQPALSGS